jgi:hypothetical protein
VGSGFFGGRGLVLGRGGIGVEGVWGVWGLFWGELFNENKIFFNKIFLAKFPFIYN